MRRVLIESGVDANASRVRRYEFAAMRDSIERGESPVIVSLLHSLIFDLDDPQKDLSATDHVCGWLGSVDAVVLYADLGMSPRMIALRDAAEKQKVPLELRSIEFQACQ